MRLLAVCIDFRPKLWYLWVPPKTPLATERGVTQHMRILHPGQVDDLTGADEVIAHMATGVRSAIRAGVDGCPYGGVRGACFFVCVCACPNGTCYRFSAPHRAVSTGNGCHTFYECSDGAPMPHVLHRNACYLPVRIWRLLAVA